MMHHNDDSVWGVLFTAITFFVLIVALLTMPIRAHAQDYAIYMPESIEGLNKAAPLLHRLETAVEGDTITIFNAGYGGNAFTGIALMHAIHESRAKVTVILLGGAYSAHAILSCGADVLKFRKGGFLMYHTVQQGGYPIKYKEAPDEIKRLLDDARDMCVVQKRLISPKEWSRIVDQGDELYIYANGDRHIPKQLKGK